MTWTFLGPLIGVVIGWGLTLFTNFINFYRSDKRVIKEILYFLLELYRQISIIYDLETIMDNYFKKVEETYPALKENEAYKKSVRPIKKLILENYYPEVENELKVLGSKYEECLIKLSAVDPIIAYRLKGKDKILSFLTTWRSYLEPQIDEKEAEIFNFLMQKVELQNPSSRLIDDFLKNMKEIIFDIASKINKKTKKDIASLDMFNALNSQNNDLEKKLDMLIATVIAAIVQQESINQNSQKNEE